MHRSWRDGTSTGYTGNHTDETWGNTYRKEHPEYFALQKDGTRSDQALCYSEPAVLTQRLTNIERFYAGVSTEGWYFAPNEKYIPFVPRDAGQAGCQCERCLKLTREKVGRFGAASDIVFQHGVDLAAEAAKRWPTRRVSMLAYEDYTLPPSFDLPDNLDVMVCQCWSGTINKEPYWMERNLKLLRDWSAKVGNKRERLYVFNYICWPGFWTSAPYVFPHSLQRWLQATYPLSQGELVCPMGDFWRTHYMSWLWHRLMWDRNADVDALLHDYAVKFYGPASGPMEELHRVLIDRYENVHWSRQLNDSYVPPELWYLETYTPEVIAKLKQISADALAACPPEASDLYRRRVLWMREGLTTFFTEADGAHKWLNHPPACTVTVVKSAPDDAVWATASAMRLVQGNFGSEPDIETTVKALAETTNLYVRFTANAPVPATTNECLTIRVPASGGSEFWTLHAGGVTAGKHPVTLIGNQRTAAAWTVTVRLPFPAPAMAIQFERHVESNDKDGKPLVRDYVWSPQMSPPWPCPLRWGTLTRGK
ncbi:MAG: DUF4838 domain-containing protein [Kiritimatiellae bacterium]|nr:DUF4838 domain-containing protein [Kiritimatiellia bacterium]